MDTSGKMGFILYNLENISMEIFLALQVSRPISYKIEWKCELFPLFI